MTDNLITKEEIKLLKINPRHLSWKDVVHGVIRPPIIPTKLKSGYMVSYTIDSCFIDNPNFEMEHVIVGALLFTPDPTDLDIIAHAILGKCTRVSQEWLQSAHYLKTDSNDEGIVYKCQLI